jgi:hypothetical protein
MPQISGKNYCIKILLKKTYTGEIPPKEICDFSVV